MFKCLSRQLEITNKPQIYRLSKGKYKEEELIDVGGYSQIWKCEGFAIKRMLINSQEIYQIAKQEINIMKRLPEHPNIVKLIDYGEVKIQNKLFFCIVMELCEMNLQAILTQEMLTERRIIEIFKQILDGLEVLHAEQISHRDLKLENIMIRRGTCKICDFGSASNDIIDLNLLTQTQLNSIEEQFCKTTTIICRPPEMIDVFTRQIIDAKVDIWQLGCILYNLCFRKSPFQDINKLSIAQAEYEIPQSQLSQKTLLLIQKMLQQDPKKRPNLKELKLFLYNSRQINDYDGFQ